MGPGARPATARLESALQDEAEPVRTAAREALDKIQSRPPE
jgi:HEAT repeat protein